MVSYIVGCNVLLFCVGTCLAQSNFGWFHLEIELVEGGDFAWTEFGLRKHGAWAPRGEEVRCSYSKPDNIQIKKDLHPSQDIFFLLRTKKWIDVGLRATSDKKCTNQTILLTAQCKSLVQGQWIDFSIRHPTIEIKIINMDDASMCDDPHLTQRVNGIDEDGESVTKKLCYDLYGKSGDQMELMSDNLLRTSIVFELRDDYYIGKAFYSTKFGLFNFTTTKISLPSLQMKKWGLEDNFVIGNRNTYPHALVTLSKHDVLIVYNEENRSQSIRIVKVRQSYGKSYLNVLVEKSTTRNGVFDENHGGIFGLIANQKYEFHEPVQAEAGGVAVVRINGRLVKSFLKSSPGQPDSCYSMSLEDIIYPMNAYSFQKSL